MPAPQRDAKLSDKPPRLLSQAGGFFIVNPVIHTRP